MTRLIVGTFIILFFMLAGCRPSAVVVRERPVAPAVIVKPPRPYPNYVWVEGGWFVTGNHYSYRQGYWAPPRRKAYRPGYWRNTRGGWVWVPGR